MAMLIQLGWHVNHECSWINDYSYHHHKPPVHTTDLGTIPKNVIFGRNPKSSNSNTLKSHTLEFTCFKIWNSNPFEISLPTEFRERDFFEWYILSRKFRVFQSKNDWLVTKMVLFWANCYFSQKDFTKKIKSRKIKKLTFFIEKWP